MFVSKRFDIWCLRCFPCDSSRVGLELYLISTPWNVHDVEVFVTLHCQLFGIEWKQRIKIMYGEQKYCAWKGVDLFTEQLTSLKSIEFECNVKILHYYDQKGREVFLCSNDGYNDEEKECKDKSHTYDELKEQIKCLTNKMHELQDKIEKMEKNTYESGGNEGYV
eukprot:UN13064